MAGDRWAARREKLARKVRSAEVEALLVSGEANVRYLTGFTGDSTYLLIGPDLTLLVSDGRYSTQLSEECPGLEAVIRPPSEQLIEATGRVVKKARLRKIAIEPDRLTVGTHERLKDLVKGLETTPLEDAVEELRQVKDAEEVAAIREAIRQAERGFEVFRAELRAETTELEGAHRLENSMREFGALGASFPPIVAIGSRAALPHARPTPRRLGDEGLVLVDWGANAASGYKSDLTRILATARISPKLERVYGVVFKAQQAAIQAIHPGAPCSDIDATARRIISDAGFGKHFTHGLGHGIGLEIHEGPRLSAASKAILRPGMVVTVEPGIYLEGWGGVRIEDDVLVTRNGAEVLSSTSRELSEISVR